MSFSYAKLKDQHRSSRAEFPQSVSLRTHRALSWLHRAEFEHEDIDANFVFLWIAFNAAYANEIPDRATFSEKRRLLTFLRRLIESEEDELL